MKTLRSLMLILVCFGVCGCSKPKNEEARSQAEVDSLVDETWVDLNQSRLVPLTQWLSQSGNNQVDFLTREEALAIYELSLKEHRVELLAVVDDQLPNWTQFVVGEIKGLEDKPSYAQTLVAASSRRKLEVEFGNKWMIFSGELDEDGNPVSK